MKHTMASRLGTVLLGVTLLTPWFAHAQTVEQDNNFVAMTGDLLIARPLGLVATVAGAAVFLVSLPFTAAGGNVAEAGQTLVVGPAEATFMRCLGCTNGTGQHQAKSAN